MHIHALYIEDIPAHRDDFLRECGYIERFTVERVFPDYESAANWLKERKHIDIIFCDIELPGADGLRIAKALRRYCHLFVFVTGHTKYQAEAWGVGAMGYLMKPVMQESIREIVEKLRIIKAGAQGERAELLISRPPVVFYPDIVSNRWVKVNLANVTEILRDGENKNHTKICCPNLVITVNKSLSLVLREVEKYGLFIRVRSSVAVAIAQIGSVKDATVYLHSGMGYPVTATYQPGLKALMDQIRP